MGDSESIISGLAVCGLVGPAAEMLGLGVFRVIFLIKVFL